MVYCHELIYIFVYSKLRAKKLRSEKREKGKNCATFPCRHLRKRTAEFEWMWNFPKKLLQILWPQTQVSLALFSWPLKILHSIGIHQHRASKIVVWYVHIYQLIYMKTRQFIDFFCTLTFITVQVFIHNLVTICLFRAAGLIHVYDGCMEMKLGCQWWDAHTPRVTHWHMSIHCFFIICLWQFAEM